MLKRFLSLFVCLVLVMVFIPKPVANAENNIVESYTPFFIVEEYTDSGSEDDSVIKPLGFQKDDTDTKEEVEVKDFKYSDSEVNMITNVVMHEVGGIYGKGVYVKIIYPNGTVESYTSTNLLHCLHAQVLANQLNSDVYPDTLKDCIRLYWMPGLENENYYSKRNATWQDCREDVIATLSEDPAIPDNVFGATCDPYFASRYPGWKLYATVYWNTGWVSGTFYYYSYNG